MTARTAAQHTDAELNYEGTVADHMLFTARSGHDAEVRYVVTYHPSTGERTCNCPAAINGRYSCWHIDHAESAGVRESLRQDAAWKSAEALAAHMTDGQLERSLQSLTDRVLAGLGTVPTLSETDVTYMVAVRRAQQSRTARP
jgi:hypothetical protein